MIGRRKPPPEAPVAALPTPSLVSAAVYARIGEPADRVLRPTGSSRERQAQAWDHYDKVGELHYAAGYLGRALSKVRIIAAKMTPGMSEPEPVDKGPAADLAASYLGGSEGAPQHLYRLGLHRMISGESWLVAEDRHGRIEWSTLSESEVTVGADTLRPSVTVADQDGRNRPLPVGALVSRLWCEHPRRRSDVDSPALGASRVLQEIVMMDDYMAATMVSRVACAGFLIMPKELELAAPPGAPPPPPGVNEFQWYLTQAISIAISNPRTASARTPILLQVAGEFSDKIRLLTMDPAITRDFADFRDTAVRRLARSIDLPPEVLLGMADSNHWSAWATDESTVKVHVEPHMAAICQIGTEAYLRPALNGKHEDHILWYDTTGLQLRPDRSQQALEAFDRGELGGEDLRDELGLGDRRPPKGEELQRQVLLQALRNSPQLIEQLLPALGMKEVIAVAPPAAESAVAPAKPDVQEDVRALPQTDQAATNGRGEVAALVAAADVVVTSALGRSGTVWVSRGSRSEQRRTIYGHLPTHTLYLQQRLPSSDLPVPTLIGDLINTHSPRIASLHGGDAECVEATLTAYVTQLLESQLPHDPTALEQLLSACRGG